MILTITNDTVDMIYNCVINSYYINSQFIAQPQTDLNLFEFWYITIFNTFFTQVYWYKYALLVGQNRIIEIEIKQGAT